MSGNVLIERLIAERDDARAALDVEKALHASERAAHQETREIFDDVFPLGMARLISASVFMKDATDRLQLNIEFNTPKWTTTFQENLLSSVHYDMDIVTQHAAVVGKIFAEKIASAILSRIAASPAAREALRMRAEIQGPLS